MKLRTSLGVLFLSARFGWGQTTPSQSPDTVAPPAQGITTIPTDAPPTGPQLPSRLGSTPSLLAGKVMNGSPTLQQVNPSLAGKPLRLIDAISVALAINPRLQQASSNVRFYSGRVTEARSALNPTLGVGPNTTYISRDFEPGYGIQATVPIDINHLLTTATEQAQFEQIGARLDVNRIRNEVVYSVEQAFFGVLRSQALVTVATTDLQDSLDKFKDAQVRYKAQAVAYIDVLRAQTDVANAQKQLIQSQSDVSRALASLSNQIGVNIDSKYSITTEGSVQLPPGVAGPTEAPEQPNVVSPNPADLVPAPSPSSIHPDQNTLNAQEASSILAKASVLGPEYLRALQEALKTRPEIWEADAQIAAAKAGISLARRSELPSFAVSFGYYDGRSQTGSHFNEPQAFVGLNIPLFDGGIARGRVQEAKAAVEEQVSSRRQSVDSVTLDVQNAYLTLVQTRSQAAVADQAVAQAEAAFQLARIRYNTGVSTRAGVSPIIEVSDAQLALTEAEQNQVNALYDYNVAKAQLDRAVGRFAFVKDDESGFKNPPPPKSVGLRTAFP